MFRRLLPFLGSLRGRVLFSAVVLCGILLATAITGRYLMDTGSGQQLQSIQQRSISVDALADATEQFRALDANLQRFLSQASSEHRDRLLASMQTNTAAIAKLRNTPWVIQDPTLVQLCDALQAEQDQLTRDITELIKVRLDVRLWLPSMTTMLDAMLPANMAYVTAVNLAIEDLRNGIGNRAQFELYDLLTSARYFWIRMVSEFRLYVSNRFGVFSANPEQAMTARTLNLTDYHNNVLDTLTSLTALDNRQALPLAVSEALREMTTADKKWWLAYQATRKTLESHGWRQDLHIANNLIEPRLSNIRTRLSTLQLELGVASAKDVAGLTGVAKELSNLIVWIVAIAIVILALSTRLFDRTVLKPLSLMAHAMKAEAHGAQDIHLPTVRNDETRNLVDAFQELREQVRSRQAHLDHVAHHDDLTELPNRNLFRDRLEQALARAGRSEGEVALLFLDLDNFKNINDSLGHRTGDALLKAVAERLAFCVRRTDTVARLGGDEFTVIMDQVQHPDQVAIVANKIQDILAQPFDIENRVFHVTASIGIAISPNDGTESDTLIKNADTAMYHAKNGGRNNYKFYSGEMTQRVAQYVALEAELRGAMKRKEFFLVYQAQIDTKSGAVTGVEALLRWRRPDGIIVAPAEFIPVLEGSGLIVPVGEWVLKTACREFMTWIRGEGQPLRLSVNVSSLQLRDYEGFLATIAEALEDSGLPAPLLELEVTESTLVGEEQRTEEFFTRLSELGVRVAVDDFGTGYSSLSYLKQFAVHILKIDRSFIHDLSTDPNDEAIVDAILAMAHSLNLAVVAEGVETETQLDWLSRHGCNAVQGFIFGQPVTAQEIERLFDRSEGLRSTPA